MADDPRIDADMAAYYGKGAEQRRLEESDRLEFVRTREILARHLPAPPAVVLDVGGAAGVYALPLARDGYEVHLIDPIELHLEQARAAAARQPEAPLASIRLGDARALPAADDSADAVLLLGPLYHLPDATERARALAESRRVLRPGGGLAAAAISRYASTIDGLYRGLYDDPAFEATGGRALRGGRHRTSPRRPGWFTTAYFHLPDELEREVTAAGFELRALLAVEGPGGFLPGIDEWLDDPARREVL